MDARSENHEEHKKMLNNTDQHLQQVLIPVLTSEISEVRYSSLLQLLF